MPLKFNIVQRGNPSNPEAPKKFYASPKAHGEAAFRPGINLKEMLNNAKFEKYSK